MPNFLQADFSFHEWFGLAFQGVCLQLVEMNLLDFPFLTVKNYFEFLCSFHLNKSIL